jgi:beta-galactosidase
VEARRRTWFDDRGLAIGERRLPFYAGAMHYWRVPPSTWAAQLRALHQLGLTIVETYVPWRVHESDAGVYDWTGQNDLGRFLDLAHAEGLAVVVRPGPHVNAELTSFGFPDHIVGDPALQARTAHGTPVWMPSPPRAWPVPSYASVAFRAKVHAWYAAVAQVVQPRLAPEGPVVAIGVDNEAQMFFRLGAYDHDYHPDAIEAWRAEYDCDPPRAWDPANAGRCIAWVRWKDVYLAHALGAFAKSLDEVGLGEIARFHNLPPGHHGLNDLRRIQDAIGGPVGIDAYTARGDFAHLRRRALACVGNASPVPIAFEVGVGFFPWFPPLDGGEDPTRERDHLLTLLAAGMRGFNLFMAIERDRYYGAAIGGDGKVSATWIAPLMRALGEIEWTALRRVAKIALVACRADARFGDATNVIDPITPVALEALGISAADLGTDAGAITARHWQTQLARALELAQVPYAIVDEGTPADELARYHAVVVPTGERVDRGLWSRLRELAEHKRCIVVIGPDTPTRDELDQPLNEPARRMGKIRESDDLAGLAEDLAGIAGEGDGWQIERPDDVRCSVFSDATRVRVVFVTSDAPKATIAVLLCEATALRDPFTNERIAIVAGRASIALPPRGVRMLLVD